MTARDRLDHLRPLPGPPILWASPSDLPGLRPGVTLTVVVGFSGGDHRLGHLIVASGGNVHASLARASLALAATALPPRTRETTA
ncbi:hypothetical protein OG407_04615 [Streptomyces sp. NBC_01515]|uniref:hypothetical protein n=1 Tax=Streptomyces sp. NBC_01515 TaxID=2903890 RepID=UPI0038691DF9